jgi:hypothetical protein
VASGARRGIVYEVILVDPRQQPAAGRIVKLRGDSFFEERISDASGRVEFAGLSPGEYEFFETPRSLPHAVVIDERPREPERFEVPDYGRVEIEFPTEAIGRDVSLIDCERPDPDEAVNMVYYATVEPNGLAVFDDVGLAGTYHASFVWDFGDECDKAVGLPIIVALRETTRVRFDPAGVPVPASATE